MDSFDKLLSSAVDQVVQVHGFPPAKKAMNQLNFENLLLIFIIPNITAVF